MNCLACGRAHRSKTISRAEHDRLLNIESEHAKISREHGEMLALLECFCDHTEAMNLVTGYVPDETSLVCRARALVKRVKGEK